MSQAFVRVPPGGDTTAGQLLLSIPQAMHAPNIGRSKLYDLLASGELTKVSIGRRSFVVADSLTAYIDRLTWAEAAR
jgi:predicted DNA-binding transcriptional regulator AlpA